MLTERGEAKLIKTNKKKRRGIRNTGFSWIRCLYFQRKGGRKVEGCRREKCSHSLSVCLYFMSYVCLPASVEFCSCCCELAPTPYAQPRTCTSLNSCVCACVCVLGMIASCSDLSLKTLPLTKYKKKKICTLTLPTHTQTNKLHKSSCIISILS